MNKKAGMSTEQRTRDWLAEEEERQRELIEFRDKWQRVINSLFEDLHIRQICDWLNKKL